MSSFVCKKCGGNHLTIKCGKEKKKNNVKNEKKNSGKNGKNGKNFKNNRNVRNNNSKKYVIKLTNLPDDITIKELNELVLPWGHIGNINFGKSSNIVAYIDFFNLSEAEYFVQALDKTPFDNLILGVQLI